MGSKFVVLALSIVFPIILFGQNQIYEGAYRAAAMSGNVYYEYQDIDGNRVKNGKYVFNSNNNSRSVSVTGTFKNGKKNGHWKTIAKTNSGIIYSFNNSDSNIGAIVSANTTVEGDYINDKREGKWTFYQTGKDLTGSEAYYNSTANFNRGQFTGDIVVSAKLYDYEYSLKGQFAEIDDKQEENSGFTSGASNDPISCPSGTWVVKWSEPDGFQYMLNVTFEQGCIVAIKSTDFSTGDEIEDYSKYINDLSKPHDHIETLKLFSSWYIPDPLPELLENWIWDSTLTVYENGYYETSVNIYYRILK